ncbi:MAG: hypothetical protein NTV22_19185 [bacterium]|nr:hypothetical protein [bacterium]
MNSKPTKYAFLIGVAYFCCMAVAHFFSIKVPVLFVYYNTPFYAYQDKIISFAVCAYVALFYAAARHRAIARDAIIVLGLTVLGLGAVNRSDALASVLAPGQSSLPYWLQTAAIGLYLITLTVLYAREMLIGPRCSGGFVRRWRSYSDSCCLLIRIIADVRPALRAGHAEPHRTLKFLY